MVKLTGFSSVAAASQESATEEQDPYYFTLVADEGPFNTSVLSAVSDAPPSKKLQKSEGLLRWKAPETLVYGKSTTKSDVWYVLCKHTCTVHCTFSMLRQLLWQVCQQQALTLQPTHDETYQLHFGMIWYDLVWYIIYSWWTRTILQMLPKMLHFMSSLNVRWSSNWAFLLTELQTNLFTSRSTTTQQLLLLRIWGFWNSNFDICKDFQLKWHHTVNFCTIAWNTMY